jgi:sugar porter (SP) family MFS transporter
MTSVAIPLYISEIAPPEIRGKGVTVFQLFLTLGILAAYIIDLVFAHSGNWHAMFLIILIPNTVLFIGMLLLPESPRWLLAKNQIQKAYRVLYQIRPVNHINAEANEIMQSLHQEEGGWKELFSRALMMPLFISLSIAICNQLTGINVFLQYAPLVLQQAGFSSHMITLFGTMGIGLLNFLTTLLSMSLIDHFGRKRLLAFGAAGIVVAEIFLCLISRLHLTPMIQGSLSLFGLLIFIFCFAIGPGVVVWLAISELYPTKVRGKGVALCLFINSLVATLLSTLFLDLVQKITLSNTYLLFAGFTIYYFLVAKFLLPETKQQTLESIQGQFRKQIREVGVVA